MLIGLHSALALIGACGTGQGPRAPVCPNQALFALLTERALPGFPPPPICAACTPGRKPCCSAAHTRDRSEPRGTRSLPGARWAVCADVAVPRLFSLGRWQGGLAALGPGRQHSISPSQRRSVVLDDPIRLLIW